MILSTEIMNAISRFYNVPQNLIKPLNAYYSEAFEFVYNKRSYILKVKKSDLRGYRKEKEIGPEDLGSIPLFLKIRELDN